MIELAQALWLLLAAQGLALSVSWARLPVLGQGAFVAVGGFGTVLLAEQVPLPVAAVAAVVLAGLLGHLVALGASRLDGATLALGTWGLAWLVDEVLESFPDAFGGSQGLVQATPAVLRSELLGVEVALTPAWHVGLAGGLCLLVTVALVRLARGPAGSDLAALRTDPVLAASLGVPVAARRRAVLTATATLGGLSGAGTAVLLGLVAARDVSPLLSLQLFVAVLIGGTATWWGPVLGVGVLTALPEVADVLARGAGVSPERARGVLTAALLVLALVVRALLRDRAGSRSTIASAGSAADPGSRALASAPQGEDRRRGRQDLAIDPDDLRPVGTSHARPSPTGRRSPLEGGGGRDRAGAEADPWVDRAADPGADPAADPAADPGADRATDRRAPAGEAHPERTRSSWRPELLTAQGVVVRFGAVQALGGVDLRLRGGEVHALVGPNGSGKSTLLRVLAGDLRPERGGVLLAGTEAPGALHDRVVAGVARTPQQTVLAAGLSAGEQVAIGARGGSRSVQGVLRHLLWTPTSRRSIDVRTRAEDAALWVCRLDGAARVLTTGEQRRLQVARAVATGAAVLLLDEPAAGCTADERAVLVDVLRDLAAEGRAVLLVEHDLALVAEVADRLTVLDRGVVLASGRPAEVRSDPAVRAAYLGSLTG